MNTPIDLLANAADTYGDRPALVLRVGLGGSIWSYRSLGEIVNGVAVYPVAN